MTQENISTQKGGGPLSRREFLTVAFSATVAAVAAALVEKVALPYGLELMMLTKEDKLVDACNEYMTAHDSLRQYEVIELSPIAPRDDAYQTIIQNPSRAHGKFRVAYSEGESPTICFINNDGVCDYGQLNELLSPETIENRSDAVFISPQQLEELKATMPEKTQVARPNILVCGDSWTRWNGIETSYPAMLQTLCDLSKKNVNIVDASATSQGVTDYYYRYNDLKTKYNPQKVLWTYHPNTDARFDAPRANMSATDQRASIGAVGGLRNPEPIKHSATNLLRKWESKNMDMYTTMKALAKRVIKGSSTDALITAQELEEYTKQADVFTHALASDGVSSHLLGLPISDLGKLDEAKYRRIWDTISSRHESRGGHSSNVQGHFRSDYFDEYTHPTALGCLELSIIAYQQLFGESPSEDILHGVIDIHVKRRQIMNGVRKNMQASQ